MPRATNSVESWHFTFAGIFYRHSSNPYNLVKAILNEQVFFNFKKNYRISIPGVLFYQPSPKGDYYLREESNSGGSTNFRPSSMFFIGKFS